MSNIRKFDTKVQYLKYKVLREVAREAWNDTLLENLIDIPKKIVPGKTSTMRCCVYKERAILSERVKIAMGGDPVIQQKIRKMMDTDPYDDPRFATPELRRQNRREWYEFFRQAFLKKTTAQWRALGQEVDIPITVMGHFADISEDEQAWANDYLERVTFRSGNTLVMPRSPVEMDSVGLLDTKCAPYVGADTVEVLQSLGYSEEEITEMRTSGAVATEKQTV